jgi:isopentenyl-diphosphate delta-isomerase (EC 5.3.3.2)
VESSHRYFDDVILIHNALPEIDGEKISLRKRFLNRDFTAPIMVSSMTGGHPKTERVNANIAKSIEELGLAMGVGSQRAALKDPTLERTFKIVRKKAPNSFICANIGAQQIKELKKEDIERIVDMVEANALCIHLNFLQEAVQPEGEVNGEGCLRMIEALCDNVDIPVIIKETGAGISREVCKKLKNLKLGGIDVGGAGGTSFSAVEYYRAEKEEDEILMDVGSVFWDWGIPAPASILECREVMDIPIIGSGGIRSGLDVAKAIALGADMTGIALPILKPALKGEKDVSMVLKKYIKELKIAMFLTGTEDIDDLNNIPLLIKGDLKEYLSLRGIDVKRFALR